MAVISAVMFVSTLLEYYPEILPIFEAMESGTCGERAGFAGIFTRPTDIVSVLSFAHDWNAIAD